MRIKQGIPMLGRCSLFLVDPLSASEDLKDHVKVKLGMMSLIRYTNTIIEQTTEAARNDGVK